MAESSPKIDKATTSSSSSSISREDSINLGKEELPGGSGNDVGVEATSESRTAAPLSNGDGDSSGTATLSLPRVNTLPSQLLNQDNTEIPANDSTFGRSKTERQRPKGILSKEAAQIFDTKIPVQQKLKLLNRIATVKDDGTVEFEVPGDVESHAAVVGSGNMCSEVDDEPLDDMELRYIPPLQIVILIVGTRGDVQPFVAIGKRLQFIDKIMDAGLWPSCQIGNSFKFQRVCLDCWVGILSSWW